MKKPLAPETIAAQAGGHIDAPTGAIVPPIYLTTTYERDPDNQYSRGFIYSRPDNPVTRNVEEVLSSLECGARAILYGSGMAAATAAFLALERPAHVVAPEVMYWGLKKWIAEDGPSHGIRATFVDATSIEALAAKIEPGATRMVWIETPANPLWGITDIRAAADVAHAAGALLAVDSTVATPVLTRPLELGPDP
jgi:cystathionine gamma-synthase